LLMALISHSCAIPGCSGKRVVDWSTIGYMGNTR